MRRLLAKFAWRLGMRFMRASIALHPLADEVWE
jgi:hypothetical protein